MLYITDVSELGNGHTLDLSFFDNITDVRALGNVYDLNLNGCKKIKDVRYVIITKLMYKSDSELC